jgi:hypothetical protein
VIDKFEVNPDGSLTSFDPIIIENFAATKAVDTKIRYGARYKYQIRSIFQFVLPAIDDDSGKIASLKTLISSRPSQPVYVLCTETEPPPPPNDMNFVWDYETDKLVLNWGFPVNKQRDIKQFQVFKRSSLKDPFELVKVYDFDDSDVRFRSNENPDPSIVEVIDSPISFWVDDAFFRTSTSIYALASIDAHGFTSNYSAQFQVSFDSFKNSIIKKLISHSGAPKPYPNMYVENELFVDSIKVSGKPSMKVVFNPEFYNAVNDKGKTIKNVYTAQNGANYKIQILNLDNEGSDVVMISIDDRRTK